MRMTRFVSLDSKLFAFRPGTRVMKGNLVQEFNYERDTASGP